MGLFFTQIPVLIQDHIKDLQKKSGLPDGDESLEIISEAWLHKKGIFENETEKHGLEQIESLEKNDKRGALVMTYSGCLLNIGPLAGNGRNIEYSRIELNRKTPRIIASNNGIMAEDIDIDSEITFTRGPVKKISAAYKIAVCREPLHAREQKKILKNTSHILREEFAAINKEIIA